MKKNILLFAILTVLLFATYFLQEKRVIKEHELSFERGKLLQEEIYELKLPGVQAKLRDGRWWQGEQLLSHNHFKQLTRKISEIKSIKHLSGEWKNFGEKFVDFEVNGVSWSLGGMSLDRQGFYLKKGNEIFLVIIQGESTELVSDESDIEAAKVRELENLLSRSFEALKEKQLFRYYPELPLERVMIKMEGNLPYELDLRGNTTYPPPIPGISVHSGLIAKFQSLLTQMQVKEEIPYSEKLKFKKMGEISFFGEDEKANLKWELWLKAAGNADAIIIDIKNKKAFLMTGGTLRPFFIHLQDYWDKKVIPPNEFKHFNRLPVKLIQGGKEVNITVINHEPLEFEVRGGHKVRPGNMLDLFQMIFNLGRTDQAERVSLLSKTERQQVLSEDHLMIYVMGQELLCWRKKEELIVVNLTRGFKAHFNLVTENFNADMRDVLE